MKQKTLFKLSDYASEFGGELFKRKRKSRRPLSNKNPLHCVLAAETKNIGSILKYRSVIDAAFTKYAEQFGIKIYKKALGSNHIHFVALFSTRLQYVRFIRALTGYLAKKLKMKWRLRPWSRILHWGRSFKAAIRYVWMNHLEATKQIPYQPRKGRFVHETG